MRAWRLVGFVFVAGCTYDYQGALGAFTSSASGGAGAGGAGGVGGATSNVSSSAVSTGGAPATSSASSGTGGGTIGRCFNGCPAIPLVQMHANSVDSEMSGTSGVGWQPVGASWATAIESYGDADMGQGEQDDAKLEATIVSGKPHTDNIVASAFDAGCFPAGASIASLDLVALRRTSASSSATDADVSIAIGNNPPVQLALKDWIYGLQPLFAEQTWKGVISATASDLPNLAVRMRAMQLGSHLPKLDVDDIHIDVHLQGCP
jgi:hypothetical protein